MRTFNGDPTLKPRLLAEIKRHEEMDQIIKGTYGHESGVWKGCGVGCTIHSLCNISGRALPTDLHGLYESEFGIPVEIAYLEDEIFEGMAEDAAKTFPRRFIASVPYDVDLSPVLPTFLAWLLDDPVDGVIRFADASGKPAIHAVADLHRASLVRDVAQSEWAASRAAAMAAAMAASMAAQANKLIGIISSINN